MKKIKLRYKILICILVVILLIPPFNYFVMRDSVMEDIYRNVYWGDYGRINRMEGIEFLDDESIEGLLWMSNDSYVYASFKEEYVVDKFAITIFLPNQDRNENILINGLYYISNDVNIRIGMKYNHSTRTLIYEPVYINVYINDAISSTTYYDEATITQYLTQYGITEEDIKEYQHYILYDVVYQSWVSGTDNGRKLNKWDYRNIKEVDNTFNFEVAE